jgi:hypothetical protein
MSYFRQAKDQYGFVVENTPMDEMRVAIPVRLVGATFDGTTLDTNFWTSTIVASGGTIATAAVGSGKLLLSSKTDAAGSVIVQSVRVARYIGGSSNRFRAQIQLGDTGLPNNTKRWGMYNGTSGAAADGCYFKLAGTALSVNTIKAGTETSIASASWNGSTTVPTLTDCNTYEIYITNRKIYFVINAVLVHTEDTNSRAGAANDTWSATKDLPVRFENVNSNNTTDTTMSIRVATIYRLGNLETQTASKYQAGTVAALVLKRGSGNLHGMIVSGVVTTSVITIYDNTAATGTIIFSSGSMNEKTDPFSVDFFNLPFSIGLTLAIATANANVTMIYE